MSKTTINIETKTFVRFWLVLLGIWLITAFIAQAKVGIIIIGIAIFLALALRPLIAKFNKIFGNKTTAVVFAFSIIFALIILIIVIIGPVVVNETAKFVAQFPETFENTIGGWDGINNFGHNFGIENLQGEISKFLSNLSENILNDVGGVIATGVSSVSDAVIKIVLTMILTLLFSIEGPMIVNKIWKILGSRKEDKKSTAEIRRIVTRMCNVVSSYVSHQVLVALIDGSATLLFVFILSLIFQFSPTLAIPMGLISFIFYLIPMFGQFIGACIVTLVLAFSNPIAAVVFVILYVVYIQIENNFIAPKIQGHAMRLPAVIILCATVIGMFSFGLLGAILAIPVAGCIRVLLEEYPNLKALHE